MIRVDIWLPDPAGAVAVGAFGAGALIRVERADLAGGVLGAYAEVDTLAVVATPATLQYQWWDPDGIATSSYRWRLSDAGNTIQSDYSAPFPGTNPAGSLIPLTYASLDQAVALFETRPGASRLQRLASALGTATDELIGECNGRDYFQHPADGSDEAWTTGDFHGRVLHVHDGLVRLTTLEVSSDDGVTYTTIAATDYVLRGSAPSQELDAGARLPAFHVVLLGDHFPHRHGLARLTGVRGWPAIPAALAELCAERARQLVYADPSYSGALPSDDAYGSITVSARWPHVLYKFLERERTRFLACVV